MTLTLQPPSRPHLARLYALTQEAQRRNLDLTPIAHQAQTQAQERARCQRDPAYFIDRYVHLETTDAAGLAEWAPFHIWPAQRQVIAALHGARRVIVLKARQLGLSWLVLAYILWQMTQRPITNALIFSLRDDEAVDLLHKRLSGMYQRLPDFLAGALPLTDATHALRLRNGSTALAFPTTGGRSYTAGIALVDEADHIPNLDDLLNAVKPTVDAGGKLVLISSADKATPESTFKRIYRAAAAGRNDWRGLFLPWYARPDRDAVWYAQQQRDIQERDGHLDYLYQEYPATDLEALAGASSDKRFPPAWLARCDATAEPWPDTPEDAPALPNLRVFTPPQPGRLYVIGVDPAEGNPQSDESAAVVLDAELQQQVAVLGGRLDPTVLGDQVGQLAAYYQQADVLVERNNHGHAVMLYLASFTAARILTGRDGKPGWLTTPVSKVLAYDQAADTFRSGAAQIADVTTLQQLAAVGGATLAAPPGQHDDRAMAYVLALAALAFCHAGATGRTTHVAPVDVIAQADSRNFGHTEDW